jgi:mitochondrial fission protein ELM1
MLQGPAIYFWDGTGDNPYFGFLALADYIIVTEDSVSMASEALSTGKPVYIAALEGGARRLDMFHKILQEQGYTRPFTGLLEQWNYVPPDDTQRVAQEIAARMKGRK